MRFIPLASSSKGNAYLVESSGIAPPLLIECGIPISKLREKLNFGLSRLAGCLVSHEHGDHAKACKDLLNMGVDCWMSEGTARELKAYPHHRLYTLHAYTNIKIGEWKIIPFPLEHDAAEPLGFFIDDGKEALLFISDTAYVQNRFAGVTILAIECNNIEEILSEKISKGHIPTVVGRRMRRNHMSLNRVISMIKANDMSLCREIHLLHLSDSNSDEKRMIKEVQEVTGVPVYAA